MSKEELRTRIKEKLLEIFKEAFNDYSEEKIKVYRDSKTNSFICRCEPENFFFYTYLEIIANKDGIEVKQYTGEDYGDEGGLSSRFISFDKMVELNELIKEYYKYYE